MKTLTKSISLVWIVILLGVATGTSVGLFLARQTSMIQTGLSVATNKSAYYTRQNVTVQGDAAIDGVPISNALVALEVSSPKNETIAYRTAMIGSFTETWILNVSDVSALDQDHRPINTIKIGSAVFFSVTLRNPLLTPRDNIAVTLSLYDAGMIPLQARMLYFGSVNANSAVTAYGEFKIPNWSHPGIAFVYINVYDGSPRTGAVPITPEKVSAVVLSRTEQGLIQYSQTGSPSSNGSADGSYNSTLKVPPDAYPGTYSVYVVGRFSQSLRMRNQTTFQILQRPTAPIAAFAHSRPYPNVTMTFDGSFSSAEGYGDVVVRYAWDFGDGSPPVIKSGTQYNPPDATVTHKFVESREFRVTLNVTDNEGLLGTTEELLKVQSPDLALANITLSKTLVGQGLSVKIKVSVWNQGSYDESCNVTAYADLNSSTLGDEVAVGTMQTHLAGGYLSVLTFVWNTNNVTFGNYATSAYASQLNYEIDTADNTLAEGHIIVSIVGDVTGPEGLPDGKVDIRDVSNAAISFGAAYPNLRYRANVDINDDMKIDIKDIALIAKNFGQESP